MGWVFLEVAVVLAIAFGIVWWTLPRKPKAKKKSAEPSRQDGLPRG